MKKEEEMDKEKMNPVLKKLPPSRRLVETLDEQVNRKQLQKAM